MLSFLTASVLRDLSFRTRLGRRPRTINTDSLASLHSTQLDRLTLTFFFPGSTKCNRDAVSSLIVGGARIQADKWLRTTRRSSHGAKGIALTKKTCLGSLGYHCGCSPRRLENNAARTPDIKRMYACENCVRPRARAHLVMCSWVFAQIPSGHPFANTSTHKMRLRDNIGVTLSPEKNAPGTARPMR